jgi:hypothetical protein
MKLGWESWAARLSDRELSAQLRLPASWRSERGTATLRNEYRRRTVLSPRHDPRHVIADPHALNLGGQLRERTLVGGDNARLGTTRFEDWPNQPSNSQ